MDHGKETMRILLPVDDSPYSQEAVRSLVVEFQTRGTEVRVLHVIEAVAAYLTADMVPEIVVDTAKIEAERLKQSKTWSPIQQRSCAMRVLRQKKSSKGAIPRA